MCDIMLQLRLAEVIEEFRQFTQRNHLQRLPNRWQVWICSASVIACLVYLMSIYKKCRAGYAVLMGSGRDLSMQRYVLFLNYARFYPFFCLFLCKNG